jgi:hypothetical protein
MEDKSEEVIDLDAQVETGKKGEEEKGEEPENTEL